MKIPIWTDNPNFNAQAAHFGVGYAVGVTSFVRSKNVWIRMGLTIGFVGYATLKEFVYDANYEIPVQSFSNNLEDFLFYMLGFGVGVFAGVI